jgi:transcriptional regulator with XRE-family HTH domain
MASRPLWLAQYFHYNGDMSTTNSDQRLADRLRAEREARGWTLAELATLSGVSRAMLSKLERAEASPTAALLGRLSAAFGLTLSQLFARAEQEGGQVARAADQPAWRDPDTGFLRRSLSPPGPAAMELVHGELPAGATVAYPPGAFGFIAEQMVVVLNGTLTLTLGDVVNTLGPLDCLRFGPPAATVFRNDTALPCRYVIAILRSATR